MAVRKVTDEPVSVHAACGFRPGILSLPLCARSARTDELSLLSPYSAFLGQQMASTTTARALLMILTVSTSTAAAQSSLTRGELAERVAVLEVVVERAESLRAIKRLQYAYGHYVEFGLWNDFADLFADDAIAHYPAGDLGREAIRALFFDQVGGGQLGLAEGRLYPHFVLQPVITLDPGGRSARGRWHVLTLLGGYGGNASWVDGVYENDYVLEDGAWKISELRTYTVFSGAYETGWTNPRAPSPDAGICENYLVNDCSIAFHYSPDRPGAPLGIASAGGVADSDLDSLYTRLTEADRRIERLLDESAISNLQHSYGYYVDHKRWDDVAELFADDATFELGLQGVYRGPASIRRALEQFGPQGLAAGELNDHMQLETIVTIAPNGDAASARGIDFALIASGTDEDDSGEWREAVFENTYVKENGTWKIASMHLYPRFATDYALGWARDARPAPAMNERFPADEPPTIMHGVYPDFFIPPFHFRNPVTGASPQYPDGVDAPELPPYALADDSVASPAGSVPVDVIAEALTSTERRLKRAVAPDAVENIVNAYSFYLDEFDSASAQALFTEGSSASVVDTRVAGGRESIQEAIAAPRRGGSSGRPSGFMTIHQTFQPVIVVADDGLSARFRLRLLASTGTRGEQAAWIAGIYEGEASLQTGGWKLDRLDLTLTWAAEYLAGWVSAAPFADISSARFGFEHPVTGAPGQD